MRWPKAAEVPGGHGGVGVLGKRSDKLRNALKVALLRLPVHSQVITGDA